ncbi:hypothetical protein [Streptomyces sp. NPDC002088]|uniref:hypothetical protein n=1 Tax=Streptomyces sp. NPDC002088 TaxID=3154665 RepID=UPI00332C2EA5
MSASVFHSIATQIRARYLNPLQFPGSNRSVDQRLKDLENAKNGQQPSNSRIKIRTRGEGTPSAPQASPAAREEVKRVGEDHRSNLDAWHAQHSGAASDLLHTFNARMNDVQAQTKPSTSGGWAAFNDSFSRPASAPVQSASHTPPPPAPKPQRVVQAGLFPPVAKVTSADQFGLAAVSAPKSSGPAPARKARVIQPGLFPKSAVQPPKN